MAVSDKITEGAHFSSSRSIESAPNVSPELKIMTSNLVIFASFIFFALLFHGICLRHVDAEQNIRCISQRLIERYGFNEKLFSSTSSCRTKKEARVRRHDEPILKGKPKPRSEILANKFHLNTFDYKQAKSLVKLVHKIAAEYLSKCPPTIYYDKEVQTSDSRMLEYLFGSFPVTFYHGSVNERYVARNRDLADHTDNNCKSYILFLSDPLMTRKIIGPQTENRVVVITSSSQWKLRDFLSSEASSNIVNLLVIGQSLSTNFNRERPYVLYTHVLFTDGLGSNRPMVLTSWVKGMLSRPHINLFPEKLNRGFAGHRFQIGTYNQPPFMFRIKHLDTGGSSNINWEGIEYRLLNAISKQLNFSIEIKEAHNQPDIRGIPETLQQLILSKSIDIGMSGIYITKERLYDTDMSVGHSEDCAAFITLASKALPRYRAIMGPFQWPVWVALTFIYLGAIFLIVYSDRLSLKHLIGNWGEIENMFWYVFGMFTNSFTFSGQYAWGNSQKVSTRTLIGCYWLFTIIITACYTSSIIAFVTLPAFPDTVDSVEDLLGLFFRVGTLDNGGWQKWFHNSTHASTAKLFQKMEYVSTLEEGIANVTQSFFWNYAFLGSNAQLEYLVQSNFSDDNISRRSALHLSEECFAPFRIGYLFPTEAVYKRKIDSLILLAQQSGIISKISNDVKWAMQRSSTGRLLQAGSSKRLRIRIQEDRQLTTADTEGMFLLMGIGYLLGTIALISEIVGGITNKCRQIIRRARKSISSTMSSRKNSYEETTSGSNVLSAEHQREHKKRKEAAVAHRKAFEAKRHATEGFGRREFNLTKTTLKELYGNYYKKEPAYVIKQGKLALEKDAISTNSTDCDSAQFSNPQRRLSNALVLAHVDADVDSVSIPSDQENINESVAILYNSLASHYCGNISEESVDMKSGKSGRHLTSQESILFGSYVEPAEEMTRLDELKLFNSESELTNFDKMNKDKSNKQMEDDQEDNYNNGELII